LKPRKELEKMIAEKGGQPRDSVGKDLTYLCQADPASISNKSEKAKKYGLTIISEADLMTMLAQ
jgi:NAD-dependent DNA ligase